MAIRPWETLNPRCAAKTLIFLDPSTGEYLATPALCHTWTCEFCAHVRARAYVRACLEAEPSGKLELTIQQPEIRDATAQAKIFARALPRVFRRLRSELGMLEYLWTYELHAKGGIHVHALTRGPIPKHEQLKAAAVAAGLGFVVWTRAVTNAPRDVLETTKYLFKAHSRAYTRALPSRRIHRSRRFLPHPIADYLANPSPTMQLELRSDRSVVDWIRNPGTRVRLTRAYIPVQIDGKHALLPWTADPPP